MHVPEPSIVTAAALSIHWERGDIEAVVLLMSEIKSQEEAEDIITALLILRGRSIDEMHKLLINV